MFPSSSSRSRSPSAPRKSIGYLTVATNETETKKFQPLPPVSMRYRVVRDLIDLGLQVMETKKGRKSLVHIAERLVKTRDAMKKPARHIYDQPLSDMPFWVNTFLEKLRDNFPPVYLCLPDGEAMVVKNNWQTSHPRMSDYDPKVAARLDISKVIINDIIWASQQPATENGPDPKRCEALLRFQMILTLAHEITHLLTGFLTGAARPMTPPTIGLKGYTLPESKIGEAGRYWESRMLGGVVEFYEEADHKWGARQPGIPWLMRDGEPKSKAWRVDINYILRFVKGDFSFPILPENGYQLPIPDSDDEKEAKRLADRKARHDAKREAHFQAEAELDRKTTRRTRQTAPRVEFNSDSEDPGDDTRGSLRERCDEMTLVRPRNVNYMPATTSPRIMLVKPVPVRSDKLDPGEPSASTGGGGARSRSASPNTAARHRRLPDDYYGRSPRSSRADDNPFAPRDDYSSGPSSSARLGTSPSDRSYGGGSSSRASPNPFAPRGDSGGSTSSARLDPSAAYSGRGSYGSERAPRSSSAQREPFGSGAVSSRSESSPPRNPFAGQAFPIRTGASTSRGAYAGASTSARPVTERDAYYAPSGYGERAASSGRTAAPAQSNPFAPIQSNAYVAGGGPARTAPYIPTDPYADDGRGGYGQQGYPQQGAYDAGRSYGSYSGDRQYR
ncbi:hypothetical protein ACJ41O_001075 [Fusarium nematophilum]